MCIRDRNVTVTGLNHNYQDVKKMIDEQGVNTQPVVIEDDVWVGANSVILPGLSPAELARRCRRSPETAAAAIDALLAEGKISLTEEGKLTIKR